MLSPCEDRSLCLSNSFPEFITINALRYCKTLRKLWCTIQNNRRGMPSEGIVLLFMTTWDHICHLEPYWKIWLGTVWSLTVQIRSRTFWLPLILELKSWFWKKTLWQQWRREKRRSSAAVFTGRIFLSRGCRKIYFPLRKIWFLYGFFEAVLTFRAHFVKI